MQAIMWTYRDGSVHTEVKFAAFFSENGELLRHLDGEKNHLFETACNLPWFGKASSSGFAETSTITCEKCREILRSSTINLEI